VQTYTTRNKTQDILLFCNTFNLNSISSILGVALLRHEALVLNSSLIKWPLGSPGMRWKDDNEMHPRRHVMRIKLAEDHGQ
jgi:hypothetical protein